MNTVIIPRIKYVDIAKGIGIIAVLFSHAGYAFSWIVPYYILMFAAASGCTYRYRNRDSGYCFSAVGSLVKSYFKYSVIVLIFYIPLLFLTVDSNERAGFMIRNLIGILYARKALYYPYNSEFNMTFLQFGNSPMWFLPFLALSWLIFALIVMIEEKKEWKNIIRVGLIIVLLIVCAAVTVLLDDIPVLLPWSIDTAFMGAFFISFGYVWEMIRNRYLTLFGDSIHGKLVLIGISAFLAIGYYVIYGHLNVMSNISVREFNSTLTDNPLVLFPFAAYGTIMLFMICETISRFRIGYVLSYIGRKSLIILCMHALLFKYFAVIEDRMGCSRDITSSFWYLILKVTVAILLILAADRIVNMYRLKR